MSLQWTYFEPDKIYNTTMYMRPAKTQVSLCIDPLYKASFLHTVRSAKGLIRMCCCSRTVYPALDNPAVEGKYNQGILKNHLSCTVSNLHECFFVFEHNQFTWVGVITDLARISFLVLINGVKMSFYLDFLTRYDQ